MTPQFGFVIAGLLFLLAMIAGLALLVVVAVVALRVGGHLLLDELARPRDQPDPAVVLGQLLVDLADHHQQHGGWTDQTDQTAQTVDLPPVIEITAIDCTIPRSSRTDR